LWRGAALLGSTGALGAIAAPARAAGIPDADLAYLRVLIGVELLKVDFDEQALAAKRLRGTTLALVRRMLRDDKAHRVGLSALVQGAGQTAATPDDVDFSYPKGSFGSHGATVKLGRRLTILALGAYLGAVQNVQTPELRLPLAQIAANEAQQVGAYAQLLGAPFVGSAFAASMQIEAVSSALDEYES
jgi:ferritin-like protein